MPQIHRFASVSSLMFVLALSACEGKDQAGHAPSGPQEAVISDTSTERPILRAAGFDPVSAVIKAGTSWEGKPLSDNTSFTGGEINLYRRAVLFPNGLITIDRTNNGDLYYILVQSGIAERCGSTIEVARAFAQLSSALNLPPLSSDRAARMQAALGAKDGWLELKAGNAQVKAFGGCLPRVSIKAM